jgi:hypothetical protein
MHLRYKLLMINDLIMCKKGCRLSRVIGRYASTKIKDRPSGRSPVIGMPDVRIPNPLNHRGRARFNCLRPRNRIPLRGLDCARAFRTRSPNGVISLVGSGQQRFSFGESETRGTVFPCRSMITTPSPHPAGSSSGRGGEKIWSWTLWVWNPCNPLKSHKTAKGIFGNPWTETA